jgi:CDP-diglyceride synthetase
MEKLTPHIYAFILPLFIANILHMLIVKGNLFPALAQPISTKLFGTGKTYRGFIAMPLLCGLSSLIFVPLSAAATFSWSFCLGFILGLTYMLAELPNSFIKRKLGISSGQSHHQFKNFQYIVDKVDSLVPLCIVYYLLSGISALLALELFLISFLIHITFSWLLFRLQIKKSF